MPTLPPLISDLALILIIAGLVTIVFKRLRQPLVLGYIVAGFLAGPHMAYTPTVTDMSSIETWSEIGVIFLMFTLGLEFSFKKIVKMGLGPVIAATTVMLCMIGVGASVGRLFGWRAMDSLFLGGMLAMSSTTIIYKAFDDLGLRSKKFAGEVLSVLILEDILGILLMVVLSALAVSQRLEGVQLVMSLGTLAFFLILWFVIGVFLLPLFLRKTRRWINRETLLVVSLGLCFLLVVVAADVGYSSAFGAFMMGSIFAETIEAESIARVVSPVKDLFGAIFFVSVGMLVDPAVLAAYWLPIAVLTLAILVGQMVFGTFSFVLSGQPLRVAMQCGFSLAQIGEFAFILASLGLSLGVTSSFLYPVVVAVSIVTTFLTPYMIRAAQPAYTWLERLLPASVLNLQLRVTRMPASDATTAMPSPWRALLRGLLVNVAAYFVVTVALVVVGLQVVLPVCRTLLGHWVGNAVCGLALIVAVSPLLRPIVMKKNHSEEFKAIAPRGRGSRCLLWLTIVVRYALASAVVYYILNYLTPLRWYWHVLIALALVYLMVLSRVVKMRSIRLERTFRRNLRSREVHARAAAIDSTPGYAHRLETRNLHIVRLMLPDNTAWAGQTLRDLAFGRAGGVMVASILRGDHRLNIPDGATRLYPSDQLEIIGDDTSLSALEARMRADVVAMPMAAEAGTLQLRRMLLTADAALVGRSLAESGIRSVHQCMVVGIEAADGSLDVPTADRVFAPGDAVWLVGRDDDLRLLMGRAERQ